MPHPLPDGAKKSADLIVPYPFASSWSVTGKLLLGVNDTLTTEFCVTVSWHVVDVLVLQPAVHPSVTSGSGVPVSVTTWPELKEAMQVPVVVMPPASVQSMPAGEE